ncbi:MAG: (Fe-S)-binding protein [Thiohalophilus sp.]|jgi:glycolate oxidase iron-sulfur subunit
MQPELADSLSLSEQINRLADQCVKCGLCLPHCPTYQSALTENESPRGRIALLQALANGQLEPAPKLREHLDHCLICRRCERVCPSGVEYGRLFELGEQLLESDRSSGPATRLGLALARRPAWLRAMSMLIILGQRSGLWWLGRRLGLSRISALWRRGLNLPTLSLPLSPGRQYPARGKQRGHVSLFTGCISSAADGRTLRDTIVVLQHLGYAVSLPDTQGCCGALHTHGGQHAVASALAEQNRAAFDNHYDAVIVAASGCATQLLNASLPCPSYDAVSFVTDNWPESISLRESREVIAVHEPCSAQNILRNSQDSYRLLQRIPGLTTLPLADNTNCCGAAGSYLLRYPDMADQLRAPKLESIARKKPDRVVTTNVGCALHLQSGLMERNIKLSVIHPLTLVREYLEPGP